MVKKCCKKNVAVLLRFIQAGGENIDKCFRDGLKQGGLKFVGCISVISANEEWDDDKLQKYIEERYKYLDCNYNVKFTLNFGDLSSNGVQRLEHALLDIKCINIGEYFSFGTYEAGAEKALPVTSENPTQIKVTNLSLAVEFSDALLENVRLTKKRTITHYSDKYDANNPRANLDIAEKIALALSNDILKDLFPYNGDVNTDIIDFLDTIKLNEVLKHLTTQQLTAPILTDNSIATLLCSGFNLKISAWNTTFKPTTMFPVAITDNVGAFVGWAKIPDGPIFLNAVGAYSYNPETEERSVKPVIGWDLKLDVYFVAGWQMVHIVKELYGC